MRGKRSPSTRRARTAPSPFLTFVLANFGLTPRGMLDGLEHPNNYQHLQCGCQKQGANPDICGFERLTEERECRFSGGSEVYENDAEKANRECKEKRTNCNRQQDRLNTFDQVEHRTRLPLYWITMIRWIGMGHSCPLRSNKDFGV